MCENATVKLFALKKIYAGWWWHIPLIPALRRQRHVDLCEFEASLVYRASSRTGSIATEKPCLEKNKKTKKQNKKKKKERKYWPRQR